MRTNRLANNYVHIDFCSDLNCGSCAGGITAPITLVNATLPLSCYLNHTIMLTGVTGGGYKHVHVCMVPFFFFVLHKYVMLPNHEVALGSLDKCSKD